MKLFTKPNIGKFVFYVVAIHLLDFVVDVILMGKTLSIWRDELFTYRFLIVLAVSVTLVFFTKNKPKEVSGDEA